MDLLQWFEENKEWVFSGWGVAVISAGFSIVIALCSWFWAKRKKPEPTSTQQADNSSINQQGTGNTLNVNMNQLADKKKDPGT